MKKTNNLHTDRHEFKIKVAANIAGSLGQQDQIFMSNMEYSAINSMVRSIHEQIHEKGMDAQGAYEVASKSYKFNTRYMSDMMHYMCFIEEMLSVYTEDIHDECINMLSLRIQDYAKVTNILTFPNGTTGKMKIEMNQVIMIYRALDELISVLK